LRNFSYPLGPGKVISTTQTETINALQYESEEKLFPTCHDETIEFLAEEARSLESKITESLSAADEPSGRHLSTLPSKIIIIRGLPESVDETSLKSLMAWSYEFIDAKILLETEAGPTTDFSSAAFRFSTQAGAQLAKELFNGKANIDATAYLRVEFASRDLGLWPLAASENSKPSRQRHKWREDHLAFLEDKFLSNPKPSTAAKREFATQLGVGEQHVRTWFNNTRQRQRNRGMLHVLQTDF
jgi:hypothetical protein